MRRVIDAVPAAKHCLASDRRPPGKPKPGPDIVPVRRHQLAAEGRGCGGHGVAHHKTVKLDVDEFVVGLLITLEVIPSHAEVERQARSNFEVVVSGQRHPVIVELGVGMSRVDAVAANVTQEEIGQRGAGVGAVKTEAAARRASLPESNTAAIDFAYELEEVAPFLPGERVGKRRDGVGADARPDCS